jgi:hypothetical protein
VICSGLTTADLEEITEEPQKVVAVFVDISQRLTKIRGERIPNHEIKGLCGALDSCNWVLDLVGNLAG